MGFKKPHIQEEYKDFTPSVDVKEIIQMLLDYVPPQDLASLHEIVLTNTAALSREQKRQRNRSRSPNTNILGLYYQAWKGQPAHIEIFVDNILKSWPSCYTKLPYVRYSMFSKTLYHEIGHHVQYVSKVNLVEKEDFANQYRDKLSTRFFWQRYMQRYWNFRPLRLPIRGMSWLAGKLLAIMDR